MRTREEIVATLQVEYERLQEMSELYERTEGLTKKYRASILYEYEVKKEFLRSIMESLEIPVPEHREKAE